MNWLKNHRPQGVLSAAMLTLALVGGMSQEAFLHAASLQESMTALGLTAVPVEFAATALHRSMYVPKVAFCPRHGHTCLRGGFHASMCEKR
jgi:hypothetical protein